MTVRNSRRLAPLLASAGVSAFALRAVEALRQRHNWLQLGKFVAVGLSGYVDQPRGLRRAARLGRALGGGRLVRRSARRTTTGGTATGRSPTRRAASPTRATRFFVVSFAALLVNQVWLLVFLDWLGWGKLVAQAVAIVLVTPLNFLGNKLWSFRR